MNYLPKSLFIASDQIFENDKQNKFLPKLNNVTRFVFFDDLCGSGSQALMYSNDLVKKIKIIKPNIKVLYYCLLATTDGLNNIRRNSEYDRVECIFELDKSFKCFSKKSRYFLNDSIKKQSTKKMCNKYGKKIEPGKPLGHDDSQLLLAFHHNTPDNCLPIFWSEKQSWEPIFKRSDKNYG